MKPIMIPPINEAITADVKVGNIFTANHPHNPPRIMEIITTFDILNPLESRVIDVEILWYFGH